MLPGSYDLALYRGDSAAWRFQLWADKAKTNPVDLTGASVAAEFRDVSGGTVLMSLVCDIVLPNVVAVSVTPDMWEGVAVEDGVWDLEVTFSPTDVHTPVAGVVTVTPDVTNSVPVVGPHVAEFAAADPVVRRPVSLSA